MSQSPPQVDGLPLAGNIHQAIDPLEFGERCRDVSSPVVRGRIGPQTIYVVLDPNLVERVLSTENDRYRKTEMIRSSIDDSFEGYLTPDVISALRQAWQPILTMDRLQEYGRRVSHLVTEFWDRWADGEIRDAHREFRGLCLRLACELLLEEESSVSVGEYTSMVDGISQKYAPRKVLLDQLLPDWTPTATNRAYRGARDRLHEFLDQLLADQDPDGECLLAELLRLEADPESPVSRSEVRNELGVLLVGALEPLAVGLACACQCVATSERVQAGLQQEADRVLDGDHATIDHVTELQRAERAFRETLRLYPPLYTMFRETRDDVTLGGYELESDAQVWLSQWAIHRNPQNFDRPETYLPSRWQGNHDRAQFAYFPFGGGPRHCPSRRLSILVAKLTLATMARRFEITAEAEQPEFRPELALRPVDGIGLSVTRR
ncbi:cytochrome P450 [Halorussus lipolyticus]|uniref:cytochrome P450 n=1 Tax=Halorussus lipolyticus TaxID=3034024 RepID=UPI0023E77A9A|nr:cytochrome P450 [Halorussus sp. DT80]